MALRFDRPSIEADVVPAAEHHAVAADGGARIKLLEAVIGFGRAGAVKANDAQIRCEGADVIGNDQTVTAECRVCAIIFLAK